MGGTGLATLAASVVMMTVSAPASQSQPRHGVVVTTSRTVSTNLTHP